MVQVLYAYLNCFVFLLPCLVNSLQNALSYQLQCPERLHLLYEVQIRHGHESMERLRVLLKIAAALASDKGDTSELKVMYM